MLIQIRGTSGSGKSTLVKQVLELHDPIRKCYREGRKQPLYYRGTNPNGGPQLAVIGHYETKCGGCDTISNPGESYQIIFDLIKRNAEAGRNVLFEGLLISCDVAYYRKLKELGQRMLTIELELPLEECLASVNERRRTRMEAKGQEFTPVNPINTTSKWKGVRKTCERLRAEDFEVETHSRESALARLKELLNV